MAQQPRDQVQIKDFNGLASNIDPNDIPPGAAQDQSNVCCIRQAEIHVRKGYVEVTFEE